MNEGLIMFIILVLIFGEPILAIPYFAIKGVISLLAKLLKDGEPAPAKKTAIAPPEKKETAKKPEKPQKPEKKELSHDQKVMACTAIIEDSFSYKDQVLDDIFEGEGVVSFSVPECLEYSVKEYEAQFGTKGWQKAWIDALTLSFGKKFSYDGKGIYIAKGGK